MPPIQKTFTLIPQGGGVAGTTDSPTRPSPARPMTSKQVRKAYKAANRVPQISRAERIKQERAEQERIRKELEKDKAAAKAKAARDKKRVKELAEREVKKKNRLPLVNVRPSQDTIARFVRGNGSGRKRDSGGERMTDEGLGAESPVHFVRAETKGSGRLHLGSDEQAFPGFEAESCMETGRPEEADSALEIVTEGVATKDLTAEHLTAKYITGEKSPDLDETVELDIIPEEDDELELADKENATMQKRQETAPHDDRDELDVIPDDDFELDLLPDEDLHEFTTGPGLQVGGGRGSEPDLIPEEDDFELAMLQELDAFSTKVSQKQPRRSQNGQRQSQNERKRQQNELRRSQREHKRPLNEPQRPNPTKSRKPTPIEQDLGLHTSSPEVAPLNSPLVQPAQLARQEPVSPSRPAKLAPPAASSPSPPRQAPPMSTQAILCNFDDFFPTSSQQARELEDELGDDLDEVHEPSMSASKITKPPTRTSQSTKPHIRIPPQPSNRAPSQPPAADPSPSPAQPSKRFFTSSGSNELLSLAIHRSRQTAALEELRHRGQGRVQERGVALQEREAEASQRVEAAKVDDAVMTTRGTLKRASQATTTNHRSITKASAPTHTPAKAPIHTKQHSQVPVNKPHAQQPLKNNTSPDKENLPPNAPPHSSSASQETEYGGDWVDEIALEFTI